MGHRIEWDSYTLGDVGNGDDLTILGLAGIKPVGARSTTMTPNANGGETRGASVARAAEIQVPQVKAPTRAGLLSFLGSMAAIGATEERPLKMQGLLWGDPEDEEAAVQMWAGPESATPLINAQTLAKDDWRADNVTWIASDPTIYSADATVFEADHADTDFTFVFTNLGNGSTLNGRAWTAWIEADTSVHSPYVDLGDQRVTWAGLTLAPGQRLIIDRHRHSRIGSLGVDGYRTSHGTPNPDWPVLEPGANSFAFGANSGDFTAELTARSTWSPF